MTIEKTLHGHISPETAYVVEDYPYGRRLRCKMRYWIETTKRGQRVCRQSTNPRKAVEFWNKPKKTTYSDFIGLYLDENEHVKEFHVSHGWSKKATMDEFLSYFKKDVEALGREEEVKTFYAVKIAQDCLTCEIVPASGTKEEQEEREKKSEEAKRKALAYGFHKATQEGYR